MRFHKLRTDWAGHVMCGQKQFYAADGIYPFTYVDSKVTCKKCLAIMAKQKVK
jgi:hypothetical protein